MGVAASHEIKKFLQIDENISYKIDNDSLGNSKIINLEQLRKISFSR